ncbi:MAG: transporter permease, partial [Segetibacter sp.]|nr:transporter permease [Segetibacter sp.]
TWLQPIGFNNAYALMMRKQQAKDLGIETISDLTNYLNKGCVSCAISAIRKP